MMFRALLLAMLLLAAALLYYTVGYSMPKANTTTLRTETPSPATPSSQSSPNPSQTPAHPTKTEHPQQMPKQRSNTTPMHTARSYPLFEEIDPDLVETLHPPKGTDGATAIRIDTASLQQLKRGDQIAVPVSDGVRYSFHVTQTEHTAQGTLHIQSKLQEEGNSYDCIITHAGVSTFITMTTPLGSYEAKLIREKGFLLSTQALREAVGGHDRPDTVAAPIRPKTADE